MVLCRKPLILGIDLAGAAVVAALVASTLALLVVPLQRARDTLPRLRDDLAAARRQRAELVAHNHAADQMLLTAEQSLQQQADQPLADTGTFLTRMSRQCAQNGIVLRQVEPLVAARDAEFRSWEVQVRGRGIFPRFAELLHHIQSWSPYVQVHSIQVVGPTDASTNECELAWTVRVNYLPRWMAVEKKP